MRASYKKESVYLILIISWIFLLSLHVRAQVVNTYGIYGGRILGIRTVALNSTESQIWITTESPNTLYMASVDTSSATPSISDFSVVSGMSASDDHGVAHDFEVYYTGSKTCVYIAVDSSLYYGEPGNFSTLSYGGHNFSDATQIAIYDDYIFLGEGNTLYYGLINSDCSINLLGSIPITGLGTISDIKVGRDKTSGTSDTYIYLLDLSGATLRIAKSSDPYDSLNSTSFSVFSAPSNYYKSMDIAPDGRIWIAGDSNGTKWVAYTDNGTTWIEHDTHIGGISGPIKIVDDNDGDPSTYYVYVGAAYSPDSGANWYELCNISFETHPNDGEVEADANNAEIIFFTTDQGLGVSFDAGANCQEHDAGIEAVEVHDIWVSENKTIAWIAAKSGIRRSTNFNVTSPTWSDAAFPTGDGSPYYSIAVDPNDPENIAYAGNVRIYKTTSGPGNSTDSWNNWIRIFDETDYSALGGEAIVEALAVDPYDSDRIFAGLVRREDNEVGGLFVSCDRGSNWEQIPLANTVPGQDADVYDILIVQEDNETVVYAATDYFHDDNGTLNTSWGVYRITGTCGNWTVIHEFDNSTTTGSCITARIYDLEADPDGNIYAVGSDYSGNPAVYRRDITIGLWSPIESGNLTGDRITSVALGDMPGSSDCEGKIPYIAIQNQIYYLGMDASCSSYDDHWTLYSTFPQGTTINDMYWDALLVGTQTGLYGIKNTEGTSEENSSLEEGQGYSSQQKTSGESNGGWFGCSIKPGAKFSLDLFFLTAIIFALFYLKGKISL